MNKFLVFSIVVFVLISCQSQGALSVNELLNKRDKYNDHQVTVEGFFGFDTIYSNRNDYDNFGDHFLFVSIKGEGNEQFFTGCTEQEAILTGTFRKGKSDGGTRNYLLHIIEFRPVDSPKINCLKLLEN